MISIAGTARRHYTFPAPVSDAFRFHADLDSMLRCLPYIAVVAAPAATVRRLRYEATEAGLYQVRVYCTVAADVDPAAHGIHIRSLDDAAPQRAGFRSMSGHGRFESVIAFQPHGEATRITYSLEISAQVPTPGSLRLLPEALVNARAARRFRARLDEIVDGFVHASIAAYRAERPTREPDTRTARSSRGPRA